MEDENEIMDSGENSGDEVYKVGDRKPPLHSRFSSEKQPPGSVKSEGKRKKKFAREMMKELLSSKYFFNEDSQIKTQLVKAFGIKVLKHTTGELIVLMQAQKAILKGDTNAANFLMTQSFGQPKQQFEHTGADGVPLERATVIHVQSIDKLPEIKETEDDE